mgnify:CR=1 FL=1
MQISLTDASLLEETYQTKENEQHNQTYAIEEQILRLVRTGNYRGFKNIEFSDSNYHLGITGSTALRQLRNDIIITTTICTRAAIEGGLDYDSAYKLSDYFIQSSERLNSIERLYDLLSKIGYSFAEKVANSKAPVSTDECIQKAIRYIQQNTNQHLTVGDVAAYVGFSRSYFSAYFKKTLGFLSAHLFCAVSWKKVKNCCNIPTNPSVRSAPFYVSPAKATFRLLLRSNSE